jgi:hypothetical protein
MDGSAACREQYGQTAEQDPFGEHVCAASGTKQTFHGLIPGDDLNLGYFPGRSNTNGLLSATLTLPENFSAAQVPNEANLNGLVQNG